MILVGMGAWWLLRDGNVGGIWYILIGFFLWNAARESYRQTLLRETRRGVRASELMTREFGTVAPDLTIADFVEQYLLPRREQTFVVSNGMAVQGIISLESIKAVRRSDWRKVRIAQVMTPRSALKTLNTEDTAASALARLARNNDAELPVVEGDQVIGFVGREQVYRFLQLKS